MYHYENKTKTNGKWFLSGKLKMTEVKSYNNC